MFSKFVVCCSLDWPFKVKEREGFASMVIWSALSVQSMLHLIERLIKSVDLGGQNDLEVIDGGRLP